MNAPSRKMLPVPALPETTRASRILLLLLVSGVAWGMVVSVPLRWVLGASFVICALLAACDRSRLKRIRSERREESICTFARALPARHHDTWIVRAVYEEFSGHLKAPIRPSDNIAKFCGVVDEDLDDAVVAIAHRARRSLDDVSRNPLLGKVTTVSEVIVFLEHQPRLADAEPAPAPRVP